MDEEDVASPSRRSDMRSLENLTQSLSKASEGFGKTITNAFAKGIVEGKRFEDVLRSVGKTMTESLLKTALKPLQSGISSFLESGIKSLTGLLTGGLGSGVKTATGLVGGGLGGNTASALPAMPVSAFADGGVIASPSYFPLGRGLGLMGESGAEAIMPLARGPDGALGIRGGGGPGRPMSVVVQVSTPDATASAVRRPRFRPRSHAPSPAAAARCDGGLAHR